MQIEIICMQCQILLSGVGGGGRGGHLGKKIVISLSSAEISHRVVNIKLIKHNFS